jgi:uncharacterized protein (TIGR03067 family)
MLSSALTVVVLALVARADAPKSDLQKLEGTWVMVSGESEGRKLSEEELKGSSLVIEGNKYTVKLGENPLKGTLKLNPTKTPKTIDSTSVDGETHLGIYELKGDLFKVCLAQSGKERPRDFNSGDIVHEWKRAKK